MITAVFMLIFSKNVLLGCDDIQKTVRSFTKFPLLHNRKFPKVKQQAKVQVQLPKKELVLISR